MQRNRDYQQPQSEGLVRYQPRQRRKSGWQRFVDGFVPNKNDEPRELIRKSALILAVVILIGSLVYISSYFMESKRNEKRTGVFKDMFSNVEGGVDGSYEVGDDFPEGYLQKFWPFYEINQNVRGWIEIPGTKVAYPVVQTGNNTDFDRVDFDGNKNQHGIPFLDFRVDVRKPSTNAVVYSHNMNDGQMFGELIGYKKLDYYKQHPVVRFDSVYAENQYKIFGVVICKADDPEFLYHNFIEKKSDKDMQKFIDQIQERSIIKTTVDIKPSDKLLTLSTCDYSFKDENGKETARFVVFARQVRKGEAATVDVENAKVNPSPVMPEAWYKYIEKLHQAELAQQASESEEPSAPEDFTALREEAKKWFTAAELDKIKDEDLAAAIAQRKQESESFLTPEEAETLSPEQKEEIINDRVSGTTTYEEAHQAILANGDLAWMSENEVNALATTLARADKAKWNDLMKQRAEAPSSSSSSSSSTDPNNDAEIYLDTISMKLQEGDYAVLMATISGGNGSEVKWDTDNHSVATVRPDGTVEARRKGKTTIIATYHGKTATCKLEVSDEPVVEFYIDLPSKAEVLVDETIELRPTFSPAEAGDKGITWKLSGTKSAFSVSTDDAVCMLTGLTPGKSVEVTATLRGDTSKSATCKVTVVEPKLEIAATASVKVGNTVTIEVKNAPANGAITWEVTKGSEFVEVDAAGNVYGIAPGKATVRANGGGQRVDCVVTVKEDNSSSGGGGGSSDSPSSSEDSSSSDSPSSSEDSSSSDKSSSTPEPPPAENGGGAENSGAGGGAEEGASGA